MDSRNYEGIVNPGFATEVRDAVTKAYQAGRLYFANPAPGEPLDLDRVGVGNRIPRMSPRTIVKRLKELRRAGRAITAFFNSAKSKGDHEGAERLAFSILRIMNWADEAFRYIGGTEQREVLGARQ